MEDIFAQIQLIHLSDRKLHTWPGSSDNGVYQALLSHGSSQQPIISSMTDMQAH